MVVNIESSSQNNPENGTLESVYGPTDDIRRNIGKVTTGY